MASHNAPPQSRRGWGIDLPQAPTLSGLRQSQWSVRQEESASSQQTRVKPASEAAASRSLSAALAAPAATASSGAFCSRSATTCFQALPVGSLPSRTCPIREALNAHGGPHPTLGRPPSSGCAKCVCGASTSPSFMFACRISVIGLCTMDPNFLIRRISSIHQEHESSRILGSFHRDDRGARRRHRFGCICLAHAAQLEGADRSRPRYRVRCRHGLLFDRVGRARRRGIVPRGTLRPASTTCRVCGPSATWMRHRPATRRLWTGKPRNARGARGRTVNAARRSRRPRRPAATSASIKSAPRALLRKGSTDA